MATKKASKKIWVQSGILERWHGKQFTDFYGDAEVTRRINSYLNDVKKFRKEGVGVYLYGPTGVGKTLLLNVVFKQLLEYGYSVRIITLETLISTFVGNWFGSTADLLNDLKSVDFLGLENVGKEYRGSNTELGVTTLNSILNYRSQRLLPTWFTSKVPPDKIKDMYSDDLASLMQESCIAILINGTDQREEIQSRLRNLL